MPATGSNGLGSASAADHATLWAQLQSVTAQLQAAAADKAGLAAHAEAVAAAKAELAQQVNMGIANAVPVAAAAVLIEVLLRGGWQVWLGPVVLGRMAYPILET